MKHKKSMTIATATWIAVAIALAGCAGPISSGGNAEVSLLSPIPPSVYFFPGFVAEALGYFEEEGIDFRYETVGEDVSMTSLLENGRVNVAAPGASEVLQGLAAGQVFEVVYDYYEHAAEGIVVPAGSSIQSMGDLEGKVIGIAGDELRGMVAFALDVQGLSVDDVELVNVGNGGSIIVNSFDSGAIDAFAGSVLDFAGLQAAGFDLTAITPDEIADIPAASFAVTPGYLDENADVLERFLRAWSKGLHAGLTNPALVEKVMREASPEEWEDESVGLASLEEAIKLQEQDSSAYGSLSEEAWLGATELAIIGGDIQEEVPLDSFLFDGLINGANDFDRAMVEADAKAFVAG